MDKKLCTICHERPRQVPDRNKPGNFALKVCRECHSARLRGDLRRVLTRAEWKNAEKGERDAN